MTRCESDGPGSLGANPFSISVGVYEYRYAEGDYARLPELAADLFRRNVEVIAASGNIDAVRVAMRATSTIPIVGTSVAPASNPFSLVKHNNRPEGNVTGVAITTGVLQPKRLQILAEMVPGAVIGVLLNPTAALHERSRAMFEEAGRELKVKLVFATASAEADFDPAFASLAAQHVGANSSGGRALPAVYRLWRQRPVQPAPRCAPVRAPAE